jgi:hypothetical protein
VQEKSDKSILFYPTEIALTIGIDNADYHPRTGDIIGINLLQAMPCPPTPVIL